MPTSGPAMYCPKSITRNPSRTLNLFLLKGIY
jgi:hypothetical protein